MSIQPTSPLQANRLNNPDNTPNSCQQTSPVAPANLPDFGTQEPNHQDQDQNQDQSILHDPSGSSLPPSTPADPWHSAYTEICAMSSEIRAMGQKLAQLDKIENDVTSLKNQLDSISGRTRELETAKKDHSNSINSLKSSLSVVESSNEKHAASIEQLWTFTNEVASKADQRIKEIKQAIQVNIDDIAQLKEEVKRDIMAQIKDDIVKEVTAQLKESWQANQKEIKREFHELNTRNSQSAKTELNDIVNRITHDMAYTNLQNQAFYNRHNLVLLGVQEHEQDSAFTQALKFFENDLKLSNLSMDVAYRLGKPPAQGSSYSRPIVVKFSKIADRNSVWAKRNNASRGGQPNSIRIQADLPKQLREDLQILYRVQRAAQKIPQYQTAEVKNYKLNLNGEEYSAWELEKLPHSLRPSNLPIRTSEDTLVFYSKYSVLLNHHTSPFNVRG